MPALVATHFLTNFWRNSLPVLIYFWVVRAYPSVTQLETNNK